MDYLLSLLIAFPGLPLPERVPPAVHDALVRFATRHDLSTPAEGWKGYPFKTGIRWCHNTFLELGNAPPSTDSLNFPPEAWCEYESSRNAAYKWKLEVQAEFFHSRWFDFQDALHDAEWRANVWYTALYAQRGYVASRRGHLRQLRALLGDADYFAGRMPTGVP